MDPRYIYDHPLPPNQASYFLPLAFFIPHPLPPPEPLGPSLPPWDISVTTISSGKGSETLTKASGGGTHLLANKTHIMLGCFTSGVNFSWISLHFSFLDLASQHHNGFLWFWKIGGSSFPHKCGDRIEIKISSPT